MKNENQNSDLGKNLVISGLILLAAICAALLIQTQKAQAYAPYDLNGNPQTLVSSALGATNEATYATNYLYPQAITNVTVTNLIRLTPQNSTVGKPISVQFTASSSAASTSNVVFVISQATSTITLTNATTGQVASANPRSTYMTINLALNGTTPVTTNVTFSTASTPPYGGGTVLYLESIGCPSLITGYVTNYSVTVGQAN